MNRGFTDSQYSDSIKLSNFNQAGLKEAEQNYFLKYANSGFSEVNNTQRVVKRVDTKLTVPENGAFNKIKTTQNQVLRQLKQQYQILRNLPIDDQMNLKTKPKRQVTSDYSSSIDDRSDLTSSKRSAHKKGSRDAQILTLQKKQLQIVISNSLKKIEELLQNQMQLKRTVHQLKLQIEGKGGVNSEYQTQIRNFRKNEKQLNDNIQTLKLQIQRKNTTLKQLGQKVAFLQGEKSRREQDHRTYFEDQRKMDDLLRKQKDKSMNAELQYKRLQMEFQIYQKDKNAEIARLTRQIQIKNQAPERDSQTIRRLQQQIRSKDHKIESLFEQIQNLKIQATTQPVPVFVPSQAAQDANRNVLQELVKQMKAKSQVAAKDNNQVVMRALLDKLGTRKDDGLKNQLSSLRLQIQNIRRNSVVSEVQSNPNQTIQELDFRNRLRELQKIIQDEKRQKRHLLQEIDKLKFQRNQIYEDCQSHRRKVSDYKEAEQRLLAQLENLGNFKIKLQQSKMQNQEIRQKLQTIMVSKYRVQMVNQEQQTKVNAVNAQTVEAYEEQNRKLRRKIDELTFALNKINQQKSLNESLLRQNHLKQSSRLGEDLQRYKSQLNSKDDQLARVTQLLKNQITQKNNQIEDLKLKFQDLDKRNRQALQGSRNNYESLLRTQVAKHHSEIQSMNAKVIELTKTNEVFSNQGQHYTRIQREVIELRKLTKNQKRTNEAVDHLWEIKQAEYGNINQILSSVKN